MAEQLVPFAAVIYILLCFGVLIRYYQRLPLAFLQIFQGAFSPRSVTGGIIGSAFQALRIGCSRGVFTNEAGMGTASIAHAGADYTHPVQQGMMGIMEVFLDTIVICTLTALVILCSGTEIPYGYDAGGDLVSRALSVICGDWTGIFLALSLCCFAFATILGWGLYGLRCANWLLGPAAEGWFVLLQMLASILGALLETGVIWQLAETVNGLMAIPNLLALTFLSGEIRKITRSWRDDATSRR